MKWFSEKFKSFYPYGALTILVGGVLFFIGIEAKILGRGAGQPDILASEEYELLSQILDDEDSPQLLKAARVVVGSSTKLKVSPKVTPVPTPTITPTPTPTPIPLPSPISSPIAHPTPTLSASPTTTPSLIPTPSPKETDSKPKKKKKKSKSKKQVK